MGLFVSAEQRRDGPTHGLPVQLPSFPFCFSSRGKIMNRPPPRYGALPSRDSAFRHLRKGTQLASPVADVALPRGLENEASITTCIGNLV